MMKGGGTRDSKKKNRGRLTAPPYGCSAESPPYGITPRTTAWLRQETVDAPAPKRKGPAMKQWEFIRKNQ